MSEAIQLDNYIDETRSDSYPSRSISRKSGGSGGDMDDVLKRLGTVEASLTDLRVQVSGIAAGMPYLATKDEIREVRSDISSIVASIPHLAPRSELSAVVATLPHLATSADLKAGLGDLRTEISDLRGDLRGGLGGLRAEISAMETRIIKWSIATALTAVGLASGLAFSIAKLVH
jgi:hypothetical protein